VSKEPRYWINIDWFFLSLIIWMITSMVTNRGCWAEQEDCSLNKNKIEQTAEKVTESLDWDF